MKNISKETKKNISLLISSQAIVMMFGFLTNIVWTRYFDIEVFGIYQLVVSFLSFVSVLAYSGLGQSLSISSSKNFGGNFKSIIIEKFKIAVVLIFLLWIISFYYFYKGDSKVSIVLFIVSLFFPLYVNQSSWDAWANGRGEFTKYAIFKIMASLLLLASVWLSYYFSLGFYTTVLVIVVNLIYHLSITYYFYKNKDNDTKDLDTISYGKVLTGALFINSLLFLDKFIIENYLSLEAVAVFAVAMIFPNLLKVFFDVSNKLFIPRFSKFNTIIEVWCWFKKFFVYIIIFYILCGIVGFFLLDYIIVFFFSEEYADAAIYSRWIFLSMALAIPASYLSQIMIYQKKTKYVYMFAKINVFVKMTGFITLLPIFGLWGMVYTFWINMIINNIVMGGYFSHYIRKVESDETDSNNRGFNTHNSKRL